MISDKTTQISETLRPKMSWFEILAGTVTAIGIAGLIALMAKGAWAESGQPPGQKPFQPSPFSPGSETGMFNGDPDDDDELVFPDADSGGFAGGTNTANSAPSPSTGSSSSHSSGIQVGGGPSGGVISHGNVAPLKVDTETAEGCKDIITDFNFPDADIMDIARTLGKLTGKNFILDKDVKGRVTIISNAPITCGDAWKAFLTALDINGFALIPSGKFVRIARQRDARDKQLKTYTGDYTPDTDALITRVFPLKYLSAEEVARNFRSFMPANSRIIPYEQTNTVIVTDTGANITKLGKLLEILDIEGYDAGIEVIPVKFASAAELSKLIDTLIPGTSTGGTPGAPRFGGGGKFTARRTKEGGIINTIISDDRTNALIVHANTKGADQIRELVAKLDQKNASTSGGGKVHVMYLQFADSEQVSNTLNNLSQGASRSTPGGPAGGTGVNPNQGTLFEGNIKIAPDKATNSLVITASPGDFVTIQRVVNKIDIPRDQVFTEVVIMEVTLSREFNFSTNIVNPNLGIQSSPNTDLFSYIQNPASFVGGILNFRIGGERTIKVGGQDVKVNNITGLIKAIQTNSNANVLATPQILTMDNTEASFDTTDKIPVPTQTSVQGAGVSNSITKEPVSLSIKIKPQIMKLLNFVKMDITAKLADITQQNVPKALSDTAFSTTERNAQTSVTVADGDTVVLGGLSRDKVQEVTSKVPILGDIPLLGWLFRSKSTSSSKSSLLIFITPRIVRQYEGIRAILDKKLKERDDFLEANTGGEDPNRKVRDKMIRELPDLKKTLSAKPQRAYIMDKDSFSDSANDGSADSPDSKTDGTAPKADPKSDAKGQNPPTSSNNPANNPANTSEAPGAQNNQPPGGPTSYPEKDSPRAENQPSAVARPEGVPRS